MEENKKKEEIQSRRQFFKKAAKGALPIIGAVVLTQVPFISNAHEASPMTGCSPTCQGGCRTLCQEGCAHDCSGRCNTGCYTRCYNTCKGSATTYWK